MNDNEYFSRSNFFTFAIMLCFVACVRAVRREALMEARLIFTSIFLFLFQTTLSSSSLKCPYPQTMPTNEIYTRICLPREELNRTYALSTESPIANALSMNPMGQLTILQLIAHFMHVAERIERLSKERLPRFVIPAISMCNLHHSNAPITKVNQTVSELGFGLLGHPCVTEVQIKREDTPNIAIHDLVSELIRVGVQVAQATGRAWKQAYAYQTYKYRDSFDKCDLVRVTGIRANGKWGVDASITNYPREIFKERGREIISEVLQLNDFGGISSARMVLPSLSKNGSWIENATTLLQLRNNVRGVSLYDEQSVAADNPAVLAALALRKEFRQQAHSHTRWSQTSIMTIPVLTCLVPVAYFTDLSSPLSFWYSVSKNIVSGIPLLIKGVELIMFVRGSKFLPEATITWFYGEEHGVAVAETWFASCEVQNWIWLRGVIFIVFCSVVFACSVIIEFVTMRIGLQKKEARNKELLEKLRKENKQAWCTAVCPKCGCASLVEKEPGMDDRAAEAIIAAEIASMM